MAPSGDSVAEKKTVPRMGLVALAMASPGKRQ